MQYSGPRPKSHVGAPCWTMSAALTGVPQFRLAVPSFELPLGEQCTARICWFTSGVFPFSKVITTSPFGSTWTSEWPLKLQAPGSAFGSNVLPPWHTSGLIPLTRTGVDQVNPWFVDIEA